MIMMMIFIIIITGQWTDAIPQDAALAALRARDADAAAAAKAAAEVRPPYIIIIMQASCIALHSLIDWQLTDAIDRLTEHRYHQVRPPPILLLFLWVLMH